MARLLNKLAQQPEPLLKRMNLDAQPERPLLQRLLSRLPGRRPGERYAFRFEPLGFLSRQPRSPLLAGVSFWKQPKVSNTTWVNKAPLESLAASNSSLLGKMDSHRVPGIITAVLLLGLSLNYLLSLPADVEKTTGDVAETSGPDTTTETADVAETVEAPTAEALTPEEEKDVSAKEAVAVATAANLMSVAKEDETVSGDPEAEVMKAAATEAPATKPAEKTAAKEDVPAPLVASKPTAEPVAVPALEAKAPVAPPIVASKPAPEPKAVVATKPEPSVARAETQKEIAAVDLPRQAAEPAAQPGKMEAASVATAENSGELPAITVDADAEKSEDNSKNAEQNVTDESATAQVPAAVPATKNPRTLSAERSNNILSAAKYIYLLGDGPLALERLGMALNAGHVHDDFVEPFRKLDAEIRRLLVLFEQAKSTENPKLAGQSRAAFMDTEEKTFPGELSAYAAHLENLAAEERLPPQPVTKKNYGPR